MALGEEQTRVSVRARGGGYVLLVFESNARLLRRRRLKLSTRGKG